MNEVCERVSTSWNESGSELVDGSSWHFTLGTLHAICQARLTQHTQVGPGVIGNCICRGMHLGGESEY